MTGRQIPDFQFPVFQNTFFDGFVRFATPLKAIC